jgi:mono/diheme cytochrome c family protein
MSIPAMLSARSLRLTALSFAVAGLMAAAALWHPASVSAYAAADPEPSSPEFYTQKVKPILESECYRCHGGMNHRGSFSMATKAGMMRGGHDGSVITPGHPEQSLLIALIRHEGPADDPMPMPPKKKITDEQIATVTAWVKAGAVMPPDPQ